MTTSGTVATTVINVDDLITASIIDCGKLATEITPEWIRISKNNLFFVIQEIANKGVSLWTIEKQLIGAKFGAPSYQLAAGTVDILQMLNRQVVRQSGGVPAASSGIAANAFDGLYTTACTQSAPNGNISYDFLTDNTVKCFGVRSNGTMTYALVAEYSSDGSSWTVAETISSRSYTDDTWFWFDIDSPVSARYFRIRETGGATLNIRQLAFAVSVSEIPITRFNRDDYYNIPDKTLQGRSLQFWYNRVIPRPETHVWPAPNDDLNYLFVVNTYRQIQDVGSMTNELEVPQRWLGTITDMLAARNAFSIPGVDQERRIALAERAGGSYRITAAEERDNSPMKFQFGFGCYTK